MMGKEAAPDDLHVLVIDNRNLVREAIKTRLSQESTIASVRTTDALEDNTSGEIPDVVVVEPNSIGPKGDSPRIVAELKNRYVGSQILVLTESESPADVQGCLSAGARGYMLKGASVWDLVSAVQKIANGEEYLQPSLGALLAKGPPASSADCALTQTERDVLRTLSLGYTNLEASQILSFGVRTVEGYRSRIMRKLGISTRAELVRAAVDMGLLSSGGTSPSRQRPGGTQALG